jgi:hypothetical protein
MCRQVEQKTNLDYILNSNIFKCASRADPNALKEQYHEICDFLNDIFEKIFRYARVETLNSKYP